MPGPTTEDIYVTFQASQQPQFTFKDGSNNPIPNGDLSAYPGANSFTFHRDATQNWTFKWIELRVTGTLTSGQVTLASNSQLTVGINPIVDGQNTIFIYDDDRETRNETLEYSFIIVDNGVSYLCDPKMYNQT